MINVMQKYLTNKVKPNYPYYKFFILNTSKYTYEIIDILKDVIGEVEVVSYEEYSVIFYFNKIDFDFKSLIKTINDDFYTDAHLFESGKIQFGDATEFHKLLDIYNKAGLNKYTYTSNKNILAYLTSSKEQAKELAPVLLNKVLKDESLLMLINTMFENDLNISTTAKNTYMHRNTVNYKLEQIKDETGLDIRRFKDAVIMYEFLKNI
ncbi:MAG: helix-turn-helix domain-containing protein [Bacilli bacterium]|nr:helix-turn-helix domain-containing protein [Bacilli bacterium]